MARSPRAASSAASTGRCRPASSPRAACRASSISTVLPRSRAAARDRWPACSATTPENSTGARPTPPPISASRFIDNYGWLEVFGTRGHFANDAMAGGFLILGPDIVYPDHHHVAEELYIPLTGGDGVAHGRRPVRSSARPARSIHHASNVSHAMRTGAEPLLALYLWRGGPLAARSTIIGRREAEAMARAIMLQGTGSDVGKTVLVAGLCRAARNRGCASGRSSRRTCRTTPPSPTCRARRAAARSAGRNGCRRWPAACAPSVHMNPVLLKPQSETGSQIVVQGKVFGQAKARDYQPLKPQLMDAVLESSWRKRRRGRRPRHRRGRGLAGRDQPARRRHRQHGLCHPRRRAGGPGRRHRPRRRDRLDRRHASRSCPTRTGAMIAGYLINKFRGDVSLFDDGHRGDRRASPAGPASASCPG